MIADTVYWTAAVAPLDDAALLRFLTAAEAEIARAQAHYGAALAAATAEARRRNLVPQEKGPAMTPGQWGRKT